jgi:hypothetical protein
MVLKETAEAAVDNIGREDEDLVVGMHEAVACIVEDIEHKVLLAEDQLNSEMKEVVETVVAARRMTVGIVDMSFAFGFGAVHRHGLAGSTMMDVRSNSCWNNRIQHGTNRIVCHALTQQNQGHVHWLGWCEYLIQKRELRLVATPLQHHLHCC